MRRFAGVLVLVGAVLGHAAGCSGSEDDGTGGAAGATAGSAGASQQGGAAGVAGAGASGKAGGVVSTGGQGGAVGCASDSAKAIQRPIDLYVMLDQSSSMAQNDKWLNVTTALEAFLNNENQTGLGVGLQYFPLFNTAAQCVASQYAQPEIPIKQLPAAAKELTDSITKHAPVGAETPTRPALTGAVDYAAAWAKAHPDHVTVVVLATDGEPTVCGTDTAEIASIAAGGAKQTPKVLTFVVGVGQGFEPVLDAIASAGGTEKAFVVDLSKDVGAQFAAAMDAIRGKAIDCTFTIPKPKDVALDFNKVNVTYTVGGKKVDFGRVASAAACQGKDDAWYYDDPQNPKTIQLCPKACDRVRVAPGSEVTFVFGCETNVK